MKSHILNNNRVIYLFDIDKLYDDITYKDNVIRQLSALHFYGKSVSRINKIFIFGTYTQLRFCSDADAEDYVKKVFFNTECENLKDILFVLRLTPLNLDLLSYVDIPLSFTLGEDALNLIKDKVFNE